jgi:hypothetical protein
MKAIKLLTHALYIKTKAILPRLLKVNTDTTIKLKSFSLDGAKSPHPRKTWAGEGAYFT